MRADLDHTTLADQNLVIVNWVRLDDEMAEILGVDELRHHLTASGGYRGRRPQFRRFLRRCPKIDFLTLEAVTKAFKKGLITACDYPLA